jgi:hypothetical protein
MCAFAPYPPIQSSISLILHLEKWRPMSPGWFVPPERERV